MAIQGSGSLKVVLFVAATWAGVLSADTVVTTNGKEYTGIVEEQGDDYRITLVRGGSMVLPKRMVTSVIPDSPAKQAAIRASISANKNANEKVHRLLKPLRDRVMECRSQVSAAQAALRARQQAEAAKEFSPEDIKKIDAAKDRVDRVKAAIDSLGKPSSFPTPQIKNEKAVAVSISYIDSNGVKRTMMITPNTAQSVLRSAQSEVTDATTAARQNVAKRCESRHRGETAEYVKLMTRLKKVDSMIDAARDSLVAVVNDQAKSKGLLTHLGAETDTSLKDVRSELERLDGGIPTATQPAGLPAAKQSAADAGSSLPGKQAAPSGRAEPLRGGVAHGKILIEMGESVKRMGTEIENGLGKLLNNGPSSWNAKEGYTFIDVTITCTPALNAKPDEKAYLGASQFVAVHNGVAITAVVRSLGAVYGAEAYTYTLKELPNSFGVAFAVPVQWTEFDVRFMDLNLGKVILGGKGISGAGKR